MPISDEKNTNIIWRYSPQSKESTYLWASLSMEKLKGIAIFVFIGIPCMLILSFPIVLIVALRGDSQKKYWIRVKEIYLKLFEKLIYLARY